MVTIEREGYTREQIIAALQSPARQLRFRYKLLDKQENLKDYLLNVESCNVTYKSLASIKSKIDIRLRHDPQIDYITDRIQPIIELWMGDKYIEFPQGIYLLNSPSRSDENKVIYRTITGYDKLQILEDDKVDRHFIAAGTKYIDAVKALISSTGETKIDIQVSLNTTATDKEYLNMSKLEIINELLKELNYNSLRVDERGYYTSTYYVLPQDKPTEFEYLTDANSVIYNGMTEELDLWDVANVVICTVSNPEQTVMSATAENHNSFSPTSIENLGRRKVRLESVDSIASQEALQDYTNRLLANESQVYGKIEFKTSIMPIHSYLDTLKIKYDNLNVNDKFQETSWTLDMSIGGEMVHECRKVVNV